MLEINYNNLPNSLFKKDGMYRGAQAYAKFSKPTIEKIDDFVYIEEDSDYVKVKVVKEEAVPLLPVDNEVQAKKDRLLSLNAISFHYIDEHAVLQFHNQELDSHGHLNTSDKTAIIREHENEKKLAAKAPLTKTHKKFNSNSKSIDSIFLEYQRHMIIEDKVVLDLEVNNRKAQELSQFDNIIHWLQSNYPESLADKSKISDIRKVIGRDVAKNKRLCFKQGERVIIEASFNIKKEGNGLAKLLHLHNGINKMEQKLQLETSVRYDKIAEKWKDKYEVERVIRATVFGIPLSWHSTVTNEDNNDEYRLIYIKPIAIYS